MLLRKYTQHHSTTHKTFTPYDVYDFENSVTLQTAAQGPPGSGEGNAWRGMRLTAVEYYVQSAY